MDTQRVDVAMLQLLVEAGMTSYDAALTTGWSLQEIRSKWADYCVISVWSLIRYEDKLGRMPRVSETKPEQEESDL